MIPWEAVLDDLHAHKTPITRNNLFERILNDEKMVEHMKWGKRLNDGKSLRAALGVMLREMALTKRVLGRRKNGENMWEYYALEHPLPEEQGAPHITRKHRVIRRAPNKLPSALQPRQRFNEVLQRAKTIPHGLFRVEGADVLVRVNADGVRTWRAG